MPKQKTHSGMKKRAKLKKGKITCPKSAISAPDKKKVKQMLS